MPDSADWSRWKHHPCTLELQHRIHALIQELRDDAADRIGPRDGDAHVENRAKREAYRNIDSIIAEMIPAKETDDDG